MEFIKFIKKKFFDKIIINPNNAISNDSKVSKQIKLKFKFSKSAEINTPSDIASETKSKYGLCPECNEPNTGYNWCRQCNAKWFLQEFPNWTSGNNYIDKFIQETQLNAQNSNEILEWIPYD